MSININNTRQLGILVSSIGLLAWSGAALADDSLTGHSVLENLEQPKVQKLQLDPGFTYQADADFDNERLGSISVWRFDVPVRYTIPTEAGDLRLGAFYEYSQYDLDLADDEFDFNTLSFDAAWRGMINDKWGYFLYGNVSMSASTDADLSDGVTGGGGAGVRYVWSPTMSLGVGALVASRLEDDPAVLPVIAFDWQINDRWHLKTLNGATISYDVLGDKRFFLDLGGRYWRREYRSQEDTALIDKMITFEVGATYYFVPQAGVRAFVGIGAARNIEERYKDNKVTDEDVDASPFFGVRALFTF